MKTIKESILNSTKSGKTAIIDLWLKENSEIFGTYDINSKGEIDVDGKVRLKKDVKTIPDYIQFGYVSLSFSCAHTGLKTLKGSPKKVREFFCTACNNISNLEGSPEDVENFYCTKCDNLVSLKGAPENVNQFHCYDCKKLVSLEGGPVKTQLFDCSDCISLKSLKGAPRKTVSFECSNCGKDFTMKEIKKYCDASIVID